MFRCWWIPLSTKTEAPTRTAQGGFACTGNRGKKAQDILVESGEHFVENTAHDLALLLQSETTNQGTELALAASKTTDPTFQKILSMGITQQGERQRTLWKDVCRSFDIHRLVRVSASRVKDTLARVAKMPGPRRTSFCTNRRICCTSARTTCNTSSSETNPSHRLRRQLPLFGTETKQTTRSGGFHPFFAAK